MQRLTLLIESKLSSSQDNLAGEVAGLRSELTEASQRLDALDRRRETEIGQRLADVKAMKDTFDSREALLLRRLNEMIESRLRGSQSVHEGIVDGKAAVLMQRLSELIESKFCSLQRLPDHV